METEGYLDYVVYDLRKYYCLKPEGPIGCPMCNGELSESAIEPSKVRSEEVARTRFPYHCTVESFLYICNECHWWCIREYHVFVDCHDGFCSESDYLILSNAKNSKSKASGNLLVEHDQLWLKVLDNPMLYEKIQAFPEKLAAVFRGGTTWKEYK